MMFALSTLARRSPAMMTTTAATRACSTRTLAQATDLETLLNDMHWSNERDTVKDIRQLMNEDKTNHALPHPSPVLEDQVCSSMKAIQDKIQRGHGVASAVDRNEVVSQIFGLKKMVKGNLYYGQA